MRARILLGLGVVVLAVVLFLVLRPDDGDDEEANPTPATETTDTTTEETTTEEATTEETTTGETTEETTTEPAGPPPPRRIAVRFANEQVVGGVKQVAVDRNTEVVLVVRSDVADEVHVHGYDLFAEVGPGQPTRIRFQADTPGRVDVELEERHVPLVVLETRQ